MGDGTKENSYTREDVLRLIEENGGETEGLDLSGKVFKDGIDLRSLDLRGIILKETVLWDTEIEDPERVGPAFGLEGAHLERVVLTNANLERADLFSAHLEGAHLLCANLKGADLTGAHLKEAHLMSADFEEVILRAANLEGAGLEYANFKRVDLIEANIKGAYLIEANLEGANLTNANLEGADLEKANLDGASFSGVKISPDTLLEDVDWGNYILGEERARYFELAEGCYRKLKQWYTNAGIYSVAGKFFFREMTAKRKALKWWPNPFPRIWSKLLSIICGYGEKPERVIASALAVVLGSTLIYFAIGTPSSNTFLDSLYYSAASFTALGYGSWVSEPVGWVKALGAFESFLGVFMMALFLVTFTRKMTR